MFCVKQVSKCMEYFNRKVCNIQSKINPVTNPKAFTNTTTNITDIKM